MKAFDSPYWNLSQAAAWVVYRRQELVEQFSSESADKWRALNMYPEMRKFQPIANLDELVRALEQGQLTAWGRRNELLGELEAIPALEWADLWISPPSVKRTHRTAGQIEPWIELKFKSSELKKRWRGYVDTESRTKYKWDVLKAMWDEIKAQNPDFGDNRLIEELQLKYAEKFGPNRAPSRSSIQSHKTRW